GVAGRDRFGAAGRARGSRRQTVAPPVLRGVGKMTESVITTGARALLSSGLLGPPSPIATARLLRELYRGGTNLYTLLAMSAARWPDRTAIIDDDGALSYREVQAQTEALANDLVAEGVGPGQA